MSLSLKGIEKRQGDFLLQADFEIRNGERALIRGMSGSGKTTLLRIVAGLVAQDRGEILLDQKAIGDLPPEARGIGMVFQEQSLFPSMNVLENATFGLRMRGMGAPEREKQGLEWLERVGLSHRARARVSLLSGGERQRVAFVRALIWKPRALLLDEPFSALDPSLRSTLRSELKRLHSDWSVPLLMVTHDEADVEELATLTLEVKDAGSSPSSSLSRRVIRR